MRPLLFCFVEYTFCYSAIKLSRLGSLLVQGASAPQL